MTDEKKLLEETMVQQDPRDVVFPVWAAGYSRGGISKREYFATMSMMGLMDAECLLEPQVVAEKSVAYADALLAKLRECPQE